MRSRGALLCGAVTVTACTYAAQVGVAVIIGSPITMVDLSGRRAPAVRT